MFCIFKATADMIFVLLKPQHQQQHMSPSLLHKRSFLLIISNLIKFDYIAKRRITLKN